MLARMSTYGPSIPYSIRASVFAWGSIESGAFSKTINSGTNSCSYFLIRLLISLNVWIWSIVLNTFLHAFFFRCFRCSEYISQELSNYIYIISFWFVVLISSSVQTTLPLPINQDFSGVLKEIPYLISHSKRCCSFWWVILSFLHSSLLSTDADVCVLHVPSLVELRFA